MADESLLRRKWWHATLSIYDRNDVLLQTFSSINVSGPAINAGIHTIFAFPNPSQYVADCTDRVQIPVASFNTASAPGYFVFRPSVADLNNCFIDVQSYTQANSNETRRIFNYMRTAAYDPLDSTCTAVTPTAHDTRVYEEIENAISTNIHRYENIEYFTSIGCCALGIALPSTDIPVAPTTGTGTKAYYLIRDTDRYKIYSIDFLYETEYLVYHGKILFADLPVGMEIHDITWYASDIYCVTSQGFYRLLLGNTSEYDIRLADKIYVSWNGISPFDTDDSVASAFEIGVKSIEYNYRDNRLYVILHPTVGADNIPYLCVFTIDDYNIFSLFKAVPIYGTNCTTPNSNYAPKIFGILRDYSPSIPRLYTIYENEVSYIHGINGGLTKITTDGTFVNINSLYVAASSNSAMDIWRVTATNNQCYQIIATSTAFDNFILLNTPNFFLPATAGEIVGIAGTRSGDNLRTSVFPFQTNEAHRVFFVDTSLNMAGDKFTKTKTAIDSFLDDYVRYNEKVTFYFYNNTFVKYTKEIRTYLDINEAKAFVSTYFNLNNMNANLCAALIDAQNNFADIESCYILSSGVNSNCDELQSTINTFKTNEQLQFVTIADLSVDRLLESIAVANNDVYIHWQ